MEIIITPKAKANLLSFSQNWFFDDLYKPLLKAIEVFSENQINAIQVDGFEVYEKSNRKRVYNNSLYVLKIRYAVHKKETSHTIYILEISLH